MMNSRELVYDTLNLALFVKASDHHFWTKKRRMNLSYK